MARFGNALALFRRQIRFVGQQRFGKKNPEKAPKHENIPTKPVKVDDS